MLEKKKFILEFFSTLEEEGSENRYMALKVTQGFLIVLITGSTLNFCRQ